MGPTWQTIPHPHVGGRLCGSRQFAGVVRSITSSVAPGILHLPLRQDVLCRYKFLAIVCNQGSSYFQSLSAICMRLVAAV